MNKGFFLLVIGLFFGFGGGFLTAVSTGSELSGHDHSTHGVPGHTDHAQPHHHAKLDVSNAESVPGISLVLHADGPESGNLEMKLTNFRFSPENVNGAHVPGEGHAHIYVNGEKIARAYGPWFHIGHLPPDAEIKVTLNANSHEELAIGDQVIAATISAPGEG